MLQVLCRWLLTGIDRDRADATPRLEFPATPTKQRLRPISNRYKMAFCVPIQLAQSVSLRFLPASRLCPRTSQTARRIRDTCADIPSLRAFLRCYASCGSRRRANEARAWGIRLRKPQDRHTYRNICARIQRCVGAEEAKK